ncbi:MAG: hypothetical protein ACR2HC_05175 [Thermoleophilaceae bacterium]
MSAVPTTEPSRLARRISPLVAWGLVAGGAFFLAGGPMHPKQDPAGVTVKEHLRVMFEDSSWYSAHAVLLVGMVLIAASLVALARTRALSDVPRAQGAVVVAAIAAAVAAPAMLLHLIAAVDADAIAAHRSTPISDVQNIVETIAVPAFGFGIAALAVIGAMTRTLANWPAAAAGVLGGVGYGLAGATFLFTDKLDALFPAASGIAVWTIAAGVGLLLHRRAPRAAQTA